MALKIDVITIFPRLVEAGLTEGVVGRARTAGLLDIVVTICATSRPTSITSWMMCRLAAGRAW